MKIYKFKCESCGSKKYIKIEDGYKCEYCGSVQDVIIPPEPEIKVSETNEDNVSYAPQRQVSASTRFLIIRLIICIFAGGFGVHKFLEGKILSGIIYILTGGLFGIGILFDIIKYVGQLIHARDVGGDY